MKSKIWGIVCFRTFHMINSFHMTWKNNVGLYSNSIVKLVLIFVSYISFLYLCFCLYLVLILIFNFRKITQKPKNPPNFVNSVYMCKYYTLFYFNCLYCLTMTGVPSIPGIERSLLAYTTNDV